MKYTLNSKEIMNLLAKHIAEVFPELNNKEGDTHMYTSNGEIFAEFSIDKEKK